MNNFSTDQCEKIEEICEKTIEAVNVEQHAEESDEDFRLRTVAELFKKLTPLPFPEQNLFLSKIIKKFKRETQLVSVFKQLDARQ